jgi:hypothetical protein
VRLRMDLAIRVGPFMLSLALLNRHSPAHLSNSPRPGNRLGQDGGRENKVQVEESARLFGLELSSSSPTGTAAPETHPQRPGVESGPSY